VRTIYPSKEATEQLAIVSYYRLIIET